MPCLAIHLAVAKKYLETHPKEDYDSFILGTFAPDVGIKNMDNYIKGAGSTKDSRHFDENKPTDDVIEHLKREAIFKRFFNYNDLNTSFLRAYFLHLICDYHFFGEYISIDKDKDLSFQEAVKICYNDYNIITPILIKKYDLDIPSEIKNIISTPGVGELKFLDEEIIYKFIDDMASLNMEKEKEKLI